MGSYQNLCALKKIVKSLSLVVWKFCMKVYFHKYHIFLKNKQLKNKVVTQLI